MSYYWVHFSGEKYLVLLISPLPYLVSSKSSQDSSITSDRTSLLKWFKYIFLPRSVNSINHQTSDWRHFIFISPKYIPLRLTGILDFNLQHSFISINFQYITAYCVSYLSSTRTLTWALVNPRVPLSVPLKTLVVTGVENFTGLRLSCESSAPFTTVETCSAHVGGFWSASGDYDSDSDITCKLNRCRKSSFAVSYFSSP